MTPTRAVPLDRQSTRPLFAQVMQSLRAAIDSGEFQPGGRIPTEPELATMYGVSRITIRRAIEELCEHGLLVKRQGKGTFVSQHKIAKKIEHISSFSESCRASGMTPSAKVLARTLLEDPPSAFTPPTELTDTQVLNIQRLHYADGVPIMIEDNYYPYSRLAFLEEAPLEGSLFEVLAEHGVRIGGSRNSYIDALAATSSQAELLQVLVGDPLFFFYREMLDDVGQLIYVGRQHITAARYRFNYDIA